MTYALRFWVNDKLADTFETSDIEKALDGFRSRVTIANDLLPVGRFYVTVNAEEGPYPARSYTVASYQQPYRGRSDA